MKTGIVAIGLMMSLLTVACATGQHGCGKCQSTDKSCCGSDGCKMHNSGETAASGSNPEGAPAAAPVPSAKPAH